MKKKAEELSERECRAERMTAGQSVSTVSAVDPNRMICKVTTALVWLQTWLPDSRIM